MKSNVWFAMFQIHHKIGNAVHNVLQMPYRAIMNENWQN